MEFPFSVVGQFMRDGFLDLGDAGVDCDMPQLPRGADTPRIDFEAISRVGHAAKRSQRALQELQEATKEVQNGMQHLNAFLRHIKKVSDG